MAREIGVPDSKSIATESDPAFAKFEVTESSNEIIHYRVLLRPRVDGRELFHLMLRKVVDDKIILEVPIMLGSAENGLEQANFVIVGRREQSHYGLEAHYNIRGSDDPKDVRNYPSALPKAAREE